MGGEGHHGHGAHQALRMGHEGDLDSDAGDAMAEAPLAEDASEAGHPVNRGQRGG